MPGAAAQHPGTCTRADPRLGRKQSPDARPQLACPSSALVSGGPGVPRQTVTSAHLAATMAARFSLELSRPGPQRQGPPQRGPKNKTKQKQTRTEKVSPPPSSHPPLPCPSPAQSSSQGFRGVVSTDSH